MRRALGFLAGHILAAAVGMLALIAGLIRSQYWQGLSTEGAWIWAGMLWAMVAVLGLPGWALLRLGLIGPLLRRGLPGGTAVLTFMACQAGNALAVLLALSLFGSVSGSDPRTGSLAVLIVLGLGAVGGAVAWAGERLVGGTPPIRGAMA